ncbi:MAG: iron-containing alcohol dehydrogenase [Pseudomonadota bacterium]
MVPFEIQLPQRTVFGRGKAVPTVETLVGIYRRPMIVHGANPDRATWLINFFPDAVTITCQGEPDIGALEAALQNARGENVDAVIALGGGSVIDLGKAVAGLAATDKPLLNYLEVVGDGSAIDAPPLPFIALPTTSGTGAEATRNAVIGVPEHGRKVSVRDVRMLPDLAIVDPALTDGCPRATTLASGLDAITQLIEPYLSSRANAYTDALIVSALEPALRAIRILAEREDADARDAMAYASYMSGITLSHAGLGAVHGLAGVIGGMSGAPHGEVCATLLAPTLMVNRRALDQSGGATDRFDEIDALFNQHFEDQDGRDGFEQLSHWVTSVGIRAVVDMGVAPDRFGQIAEMAQASSSMKANPVQLSVKELTDLLAK